MIVTKQKVIYVENSIVSAVDAYKLYSLFTLATKNETETCELKIYQLQLVI